MPPTTQAVVQPYRPPNASETMSPSRPTRYSADPARSNDRRPLGRACSCEHEGTPAATATMPIGTLNQNTLRQPMPVRSPPRIGPSIRPAPITIALIPSARPELVPRERVGHQRGGGGHDQRPAHALDHAPEDQEPGRRGDRAEQRRHGEDRETGGERPHPADHVGEATGVEHEDGGHERVADDDPEQREQVRVEVAQDVRQRDDERARVQRREEGAEARDPEHPPPIRVPLRGDGFGGVGAGDRLHGERPV